MDFRVKVKADGSIKMFPITPKAKEWLAKWESPEFKMLQEHGASVPSCVARGPLAGLHLWFRDHHQLEAYREMLGDLKFDVPSPR